MSSHPDAPAIDRLGTRLIRSRIDVTRQAIAYWRKKGVPKEHRKTLREIAKEEGYEVPELRKMRDRLTD